MGIYTRNNPPTLNPTQASTLSRVASFYDVRMYSDDQTDNSCFGSIFVPAIMKQTDYIIRGFILMLVLVMTAWFINTLLNIKPAPSNKNNDHDLAVEQTKPVNKIGQQLFRENCATCHAVNKHLAGPALAGY